VGTHLSAVNERVKVGPLDLLLKKTTPWEINCKTRASTVDLPCLSDNRRHKIPPFSSC
jgi:hypothetical protein